MKYKYIYDMLDALEKIRSLRPIVLNITNHVTMDFVANCLLAIGASPIMSEDITEIAELLSISSALNLNIGTLNSEFIELVKFSASCAKAKQIPIVLDPVGVGASNSRTSLSRQLIPFASIIRGNQTELMILSGDIKKSSTGIDSKLCDDELNEATLCAKNVSKAHNLIVAMTGKVDVITDSNRVINVSLGSSLMQYITGMGCALTSILAAFSAVEKDPMKAALYGIICFGLCGTLVSSKSPASFKVEFIDNLFSINSNTIENNIAIIDGNILL